MMYYYDGLNYFKFKDHIDIGVDTAMFHDKIRSIKKQLFLLMESAPSSTNWQSVSKLKKPGMYKLSSLQAIAHGSDSVQYSSGEKVGVHQKSYTGEWWIITQKVIQEYFEM